MISDLIAASKPTELIRNLSLVRSCAAPSTYANFKNSVANLMKVRKECGDPPGLLPGGVPTSHLDNIEQYRRFVNGILVLHMIPSMDVLWL